MNSACSKTISSSCSCDSKKSSSLKKADVGRLYGHTYNANSPSEDRFLMDYVSNSANKKNPIQIACVLDGHGGWQVSEFVSNRLLQGLHNIFSIEISNFERKDEITIDKFITDLFNDIEGNYISSIKESYQLGFGEVAKVGSCVLAAVKIGEDLIVANCGDCRAVIGSQITHEKETSTFATRVTMDHNSREMYEHLKLELAHPNEHDIVRCKSPHACYVKGRLQLTRSIGDLYLKHAEFNAPPNSHRSKGRHIPLPFTPPYVSHEPDIHHIHLDNSDKFLIIASDGVWDFLSDDEAVHIVSTCSSKEKSAEAIVDKVLEKAAKECEMTVAELKALPPGRHRRSRHDDTTVVVMYF